MKREIRCSDCRFWKRMAPTGRHKDEGHCYRNAPAPMMNGAIHDDGETRLSLVMTLWPTTSENEWCGEFMKKRSSK